MTDRSLQPPTVSVVIPCFNYGRFLPSAVRSALTQEGVQVDVVIVDDASTDGSLEVARALASEHRSVTVVAHPSNKGPVETFNDGLALVTGEFLVRLDADDMLTPGSLARATALARAYPRVGLVYGRPLHFVGEPPRFRRRVRSWTVWPGRQWLADRCRSGLNVITAPEVVMRTSVVERVGGQEPLPYTHDMEMWLRISAFSDVGRVNGPDQAWHREHSKALSSGYQDAIADLVQRRAAFNVLFRGPVGGLREAESLRRLADQALAREALRHACHLLDRGRATDEAIAELVRFAHDIAPTPTTQRQRRQLQRRIDLGVDRARRRPWYIGAAALHRIQNEIAHHRWKQVGTWERVGRGRRVKPQLLS